MKKKKSYVACTVISKNYLGYAKTLCESYLKHNPDSKFYILLSDENSNSNIEINNEIFEVVFINEIEVPNIRSLAFKFDAFEFNCNLKASFMKFLIVHKEIDKLMYFDADILIYSDVEIILEALDNYNIVLTPHTYTPLDNNGFPSEQGFLLSGIFNMGFIAINNSDESYKFLNWWESRCLEYGYNEVESALFADQRWIDLVPYYFDSVHILKHLGCNVAFWNLHERKLEKVQNKWMINSNYKLIFYHFSGIILNDLNAISKCQTRYDFKSHLELKEIFEEYKERLLGNDYYKYSKYKYSYGYYDTGEKISLLARRMYAAYFEEFADQDPFSSQLFYMWAKKNFLIDSSKNANTMKELESKFKSGKKDIKIQLINGCMNFLLKIVGVEKYTLFLKYLAYISKTRNQKHVLGG